MLSDFYKFQAAASSKFAGYYSLIMKKINALLCMMLLMTAAYSQTDSTLKNQTTMKLNAGMITEKLKETKDFYANVLAHGVTFENDHHVRLHPPGRAWH